LFASRNLSEDEEVSVGMSMNKKVSIIIPACNAEAYIEECLNSACNQTYDNLQIIVVDDGSQDRTCDIISSFAQKDKRIIALHKENGGVSSARNLALQYADGEYISFLDADDVMEADAISTLVKAIETNHADWVSCQYSRWDEAGVRLEDYNFIVGERAFLTDIDRISFIVKEYLNYLVGYEVWDKLFKTAIIRDSKLEFPENTSIGEDLAFNLKYLSHINKLICIPERCIRYKIHSNSAMGEHKKLSDKLSEDLLLLEDLWEYFMEIKSGTFIDQFPLVFAKLMEHSYIGHTPAEVTDAFIEIGNMSFARDRYSELESKKDTIIAMNPPEIARLKYRYHMYLKSKLLGESVPDLLSRSIYNCYRVIRGREPIERWKMPY